MPIVSKLIRWIVPPIVYAVFKKTGRYLDPNNEQKRRLHFKRIEANVDDFVRAYKGLPDDAVRDAAFMERFIIEKIGLNNEALHEQPGELQASYGTGLFIWQNPKQFAQYLVWLMNHAGHCTSYLEIGCRWGGTFIVVCEALRRANPAFKLAIAADLVEETPFIKRYRELVQKDGLEVVYFRGSSTSAEFSALVNSRKPDITFIDGDHSMAGALKDHMLVRDHSKIVVHHDITSDACPDTTQLWQYLVALETSRKTVEFTEQYSSVPARYLGIGVMFR